MAYLTLNEQLAAAQKFWPDTQWRLFNGEKVVGFNPNTGDGLRIESDARGQVYSVVVGTPFKEPILVNKPLGTKRTPFLLRSPGGEVLWSLREHYRTAGRDEQVWEDRPWTWKPDKYGGSVAYTEPPPTRQEKHNTDKNGHIRPFNHKLPKFNNPFDGWQNPLGQAGKNIGEGIEDTFNKVLLTGGILAGVLGLTFIIANRK